MSSDELLLLIYFLLHNVFCWPFSFSHIFPSTICFGFYFFFFFNSTMWTSGCFSSKCRWITELSTVNFIFSKHYFCTLFICWLCRLFGSPPALGVSEKEFFISFYASYNLFLKLSWPTFLFFTSNLSEFLFLSIFFIWHNFSFLNFALKQWTKWGLIALSGCSYGLC